MLLVFGLLVLFSGWAQSQQSLEKSGPPATNRLYSPEPNQKAATGNPTAAQLPAVQPPAAQLPAAQPPIVINVLPTPKSEADKEDERKEKREKAESDKKMVQWTEALARFTSYLFYATVALGVITLLVAGVVLYQVRLVRADLRRRGSM
jgi:hypothetical protein